MALNFPPNPTEGDLYTSGSNIWQYNGTAWVIQSTEIIPVEINQFRNIAADIGSTTANTPTDTLTVIGDDSISTTIVGDTLTLAFTGEVGGGGATSLDGLNDVDTAGVNDGNALIYSGGTWGPGLPTFDALQLAGVGATVSEFSTDGTLAGNANDAVPTEFAVKTYVDAQIAAIPDPTFASLNDLPTGLSIDQIYMQAIVRLVVTNNSTLAYLFNSHYTGNNPTIFAISGTTIAFKLNAGGHPFEIQDPAGDPYDTGLVHVSTDGTVSTGSSAQGKDSGTLYWQVPDGISGNYRYQCQTHVAMVGPITVKSFLAL